MLIRSFLFPQAGEEINDPYRGLQTEASGEWYDAGDYEKDVATAAITAARLFDAHLLLRELPISRCCILPEADKFSDSIDNFGMLAEATVGFD